ncbi:tRNA1(Val) (adenine(37)-N6)-methyltransferase [Marivirga arenosa]|uniref:Methyltransferase n=1 Tax=Marivirga arenosa TaxID=3059076 RepID=A0AA51ZV46_9BACT|nr:methyltransferase [Marivirga sp. BKB1-2]WNB17307.1 methyltransferase [Marivirga sp. BKB1-2]
MSEFIFKKFTVRQKDSAAKITTDATVFATQLEIPDKVNRVLEIGTGTGVLSLILAQRFENIHIDAIDINEKATNEARYNFNNSVWHERLNAVNVDFKQFNNDSKYDLIFTNPPFFNNHLQSKSNQAKNTAYHTDQLSFHDLAKGIELNLADGGELHIMLPEFEMKLFEMEINKLGFNCFKSVCLMHKPNSKTIRLFKSFKREEISTKIQNGKIYIRDENNNFHPFYISLMKDFLTIF